MDAKRLKFGEFEFDLSTEELRQAGEVIRLQTQPARVLACLLENAGGLVTRE